MVGNARWNLAPQPQAQGLNLGGAVPASGVPGASPYQMPQVPWAQNPMITTAALGLLGGRTLNEGLQNVAQIAPAGLAAKTAMQRDMYTAQQNQIQKQETLAEQAAKRAAMNAAIKIKSNQPLTPADQAALEANPEVMLQFGMPEPHDYMEVDGQIFDKTTGQMVNVSGPGGVKKPKTPEVLQFQQDQRQSSAYKTLALTKPAYESMVKSATVKGGAADLDIVYGVAKLLDPLGAVRDQDTGHIENAAGYPQWLQGIIEGVNSGQAMTAETRNALLQMAKQRMSAMEKAFEYDRQQALKLAERRGFDPEDVLDLEDIAAFDPALTTGATAPPPDPNL